MQMKDRVEELARLRAQKHEMGGKVRVERQRSRGKLDARQRTGLLFDAGTFEELASRSWARWPATAAT
jgi:acetyl-CoA carboxylase carboxyltransferase component